MCTLIPNVLVTTKNKKTTEWKYSTYTNLRTLKQKEIRKNKSKFYNYYLKTNGIILPTAGQVPHSY